MNYHEKNEQRARTLLDRWPAGIAEIYAYSASHRSLTIRIRKETGTGYLEVGFVSCDFITGPTTWDNCNLNFVRKDMANGDFSYLIFDQRAGFFSIGGELSIAEHI